MAVGSNPWPYQHAMIPLDQCFIDYEYQRDSIPAFIQRIVAEFDIDLVGTLIGSRRKDGRVALIDGQQRHYALKELGGFNEVGVNLYSGLAVRREAELFVKFNFDRKNMQPWHRYRGMRVAGDKMIKAVDQIVEQHALLVGPSANPEDMIGATDTLLAIYRGDTDVIRSTEIEGPEVLARVLEAVADAWRGTSITWKQGKTGAMLRGVARWVSVNPTVPAHALALALKTIEPSMVLQSAKELQKGGSGSGKGRKIEAVIERVYARHGEASYRVRKAG